MGFVDIDKNVEYHQPFFKVFFFKSFDLEHNVEQSRKYHWLSHQWWVTVRPLNTRCIKQLLRHGSELWAVASSARVSTQLLPQPSRIQLRCSLQPPNDIRIWPTAAAGPGIQRYDESNLRKRNPLYWHVEFVCLGACCWLKLYPAFLWAGVPDDSRRSHYDLVLVTPGSQSHHTAFRFGDGCRQAGGGQDAAQRDGLHQSHQAGWRWRHVSAYECVGFFFFFGTGKHSLWDHILQDFTDTQ